MRLIKAVKTRVRELNSVQKGMSHPFFSIKKVCDLIVQKSSVLRDSDRIRKVTMGRKRLETVRAGELIKQKLKDLCSGLTQDV